MSKIDVEKYSLKNVNVSKENKKKANELYEYAQLLFYIAKGIKDYRLENNLTQKEMADILEISPIMVSKLETGSYNPTLKQLLKVSYKLTGSRTLFVNIMSNTFKALDDISPVKSRHNELSTVGSKVNKNRKLVQIVGNKNIRKKKMIKL